MNPSRHTGRYSWYDQFAGQMDWGTQERKRVADDSAPQSSVVSGKLLVPVTAQPFIATQLEHYLRRGRANQSSGVSARIQLKWADLTADRCSKLESLPTQRGLAGRPSPSVGSLVVNLRPDTAI